MRILIIGGGMLARVALAALGCGAIAVEPLDLPSFEIEPWRLAEVSACPAYDYPRPAKCVISHRPKARPEQLEYG